MTESEPFNRRKACRYGEMLYNIHDVFIGRSLDLYGEYSEGEMELFRRMLRPGHVVVEVGANIGTHTLFFARQVGPTGAVLAFEPQRIVFQTLCANLALNSVANVDCRRQAVGDVTGEIVVPEIDYRRDANFGGLALGSHQDGERVPLVTIDGLNLRRCHLMKIDVEGMEQAVLQGATATLSRLKPVLYVENDRDQKSADLIRFLDAQGYTMFWHAPPLFNPRNFFNNPQDVFGNIVSRNMLCLHKSIPHNIEGIEAVRVPDRDPGPGAGRPPARRSGP
jgi:FkbM family methyltransferase